MTKEGVKFSIQRDVLYLMRYVVFIVCFSIVLIACFAAQAEALSDGGQDNNDTRGSVSRGDSGHSDQSESSRSTLESSTNTPDTENQDLPATPDV